MLHFTYAFDLLAAPDVGALTPVEKLLRANVQSLIATHGGEKKIRAVFTDDAACDTMLRRHADERLLRGWHEERKGMHRGDVCRGVALYQMGGEE